MNTTGKAYIYYRSIKFQPRKARVTARGMERGGKRYKCFLRLLISVCDYCITECTVVICHLQHFTLITECQDTEGWVKEQFYLPVDLFSRGMYFESLPGHCSY
jgi:hypothetical protein